MKKLFILLSIIGLIGGCTTKSDDESTTSLDNTKIVGFDDTFAPMGFKDDSGEIVGFDIDLADEVSKRTGLTFVFQSIDWSMKETELNGGNIDMIWNGYTITEQRSEKVLFSMPYMSNAQIIVVKEESDINSMSDLAGKIVATQTSSSAYDAIVASGIVTSLANQEVISYSSYNEVFADLINDRADAVVVDETLGRYYMKDMDGLRVLQDNFGEEEYGIGFRKDDVELKELIDKALQEIIDDGTYAEIYAKWFKEQ